MACPVCGFIQQDIPTHTSTRRLGADAPLTGLRTESYTRVFVPGEIFAGRYRIVNLLGRGGMGEVYRADDLRMGQPVALKFVTAGRSSDVSLGERLLREAQLARRITHPNVCRIYDIGERDDELYLSMEYIDGENLRSLLRRVGRLSFEKAVDVAQQLCAGLAAAHDQAILHLDFKPENVMIDGRGRALITDFGGARRVEQERTKWIVGTPSYMPPEQRTGGALTVQTDLYALGLVLFEIFTGVRRGAHDSLLQRIADDASAERLPGSHSMRDLDPQVERVIAACVQLDASNRPRSAAAIAAALPGGEALSAALAAGRMPSPAMVAAARRETPRPAMVAVLAIVLMAGTVAVATLNRRVLSEIAPALSPAVLLARAEDVLRAIDREPPQAYRAYWFTSKRSYREQALDRTAPFGLDDASAHQTPHRLRFTLRESPAPLLPANVFGVVLYRDPPSELPGMFDVTLDDEGRLIRLCGIPGGHERLSHVAVTSSVWDRLFTRAGLHVDELTPADPTRIPPMAYDSSTEWKTSPGGLDLRVTAAAFDGEPVYFDVGEDRRSTDAVGDREPDVSRLTADPTALFVAAVVGLACAVFIARHHLLRGEADTRGMWRIVLYLFVLNSASIALLPDHISYFGEEYFLVAKLLGWGLYWCATAAVLYLAFEPTVRRRWPELLIAWNRVMAGSLRDPLVGRDLIVGAVAGTVAVCLMWLAFAAGQWFGVQAAPPFQPALESFRDPRHVAALIIFLHAGSIAAALAGVFLLVLMNRLLHSTWLASAAWIGVFVALNSSGLRSTSDWRVALPLALAPALIAAIVLVRFGLLALTATLFTTALLTRSPAALEFSAWYATRSLTALAVVIAIGAYGAYASLVRHSQAREFSQRVALRT